MRRNILFNNKANEVTLEAVVLFSTLNDASFFTLNDANAA